MKQESPAVYVARGASFIFAQSFGTTIIQIVAFAIVARLISPVDMGIMAAFTLTLSFCAILISLGLPNAATKFIAEYLGKGDNKKAGSIFYKIFRVHLILLLLTAAIFLIFSDPISILLLKDATYTGVFRLLAIDIIPAGLFPILYSSLVGMQKIRHASTFNFLKTVIRQILIVSFLLTGLGLFGIVLAWLISDTINCLQYFVAIFRFFGKPSFAFSSRFLLKFSYPLYIGGFVTFLQRWFDQGLLLAFLPIDELGIYSVVLRAFNVLNGIAIALTTALFSKFSEIDGKHGIKSVEDGIFKASRYASLILMPLGFGLVALAQPAITLFAGETYAVGFQPLMMLSFFFAITAIQMAFGGVLLVLHETKLAFGIIAANASVGIALELLLLPQIGIMGAAIARGVTMVVGVVLSIWIIRKKIDLRLEKKAFWKSLTSSLVMVIVVLTSMQLLYNEYLLPVYLILAFITYIAMLKILRAVNTSDIELIRSYLGKRLKFLIYPIEVFFLGRKKDSS